MIDLTFFYDFIGKLLPFELFDATFMVRALIGLLLLAPMTGMMGVQVVNGRKAFFVDAISHTAFAGVAVGVLSGLSPYWSMPFVAVVIAVVIVFFDRRSRLSGDSVVGVVFSGVVAFGLAIVSRQPGVKRDMLRFLYGDILTITDGEVLFLFALLLLLSIFQAFSFNSLLYISLNSTLAKAHEVRVKFFQYGYAVLLSLVIIFSVWWVGVFLVTGMLIIPAATARNLARSAGAMFHWSIGVSVVSCLGGLIISAQPWAQTATGATIILVALFFFLLSALISRLCIRVR